MKTNNNYWIIKTKLVPPTHTNKQVERRSLTEKFEYLQNYRLCIIHGFAGYGKTTMLKGWYDNLQKKSEAVAWVSFDKSDQNIDVFFAYLVEVIDQLGLNTEQLRELLKQDICNMPIYSLVSVVIDTLSKSNKRLYLFFDDYHLAMNTLVDELSHKLISYAPENLRVIIATRIYPEFPLENLRAQGHVVDISSKELAFNAGELSTLCDEKLPQNEVSRLLKLTEGWPIACHMVSYLLNHKLSNTEFLKHFSGNTQELSLYISEQIFNTLTEDEQNFLMLTSVTGRFTGELANELNNDMQSSWATLEMLTKKKMFLIPLDSEGQWYRYHHLFADYLYKKLQRTQGETFKDIHRRASRWLFKEGYIPEAIDQAFKAEDPFLAAKEVDDAGGWRLAFEGKLDFMSNFLERLSTEIMNVFPRLFLASLMKLVREGRDIQARKKALEFKKKSQNFNLWQDQPISEEVQMELRIFIDSFLDMYADTPTTDEKLNFLLDMLKQVHADDKILLYMLKESIMRQYLERGEISKTSAICEEWQTLTADFTYSSVYSFIDLAVIDLMQAKLQKANDGLNQAKSLVDKYPTVDFNLHSAVSAFIAELAYLNNDIDKAFSILTSSLDHLEQYDAGLVHYAPAYTSMIGIMRIKGDKKDVLKIIKRAETLAEERKLPRLKTLVELLKIKFFLLAEDLEGAKIAAERLELEKLVSELPCSRDLSIYIPERANLVLARLTIMSQKPEKALKLLLSLENSMKQEGRNRLLAEVYLLTARANFVRGAEDHTIEYILKAVYICMHENYKRVFVDEGKQGVDLYKLTLGKIINQEKNHYVMNFLQEIIQETLKEVKQISSSSFGFELTDIEYQVIVKLAKGYSNKEIAREINISVDTVKYRLKKVYKKWNLGSRSEVAKFAQENILKDIIIK